MYIIENEFAKVEISSHAAEIVSFVDKSTNSERMYQPQPGFWQGRNPILFPQVSSTVDKKYFVEGKEYSLGNHGFARNAEFTLEYQNDEEISLYFESDSTTLLQYPFNFKLIVTYKLEEKKLNIKYAILNKNNKIMPFGFGLHPAFKVPVFENEVYEDYHIDFSKPEKQGCPEAKFIVNSSINLSRDVFKEFPTLMFKDLNSESVILRCNKYGIKIGICNFPILAIWTPSDAPFVCIEPWLSGPVNDFESKNLEDRTDNIKLAVNDTFIQEYYIELI